MLTILTAISRIIKINNDKLHPGNVSVIYGKDIDVNSKSKNDNATVNVNDVVDAFAIGQDVNNNDDLINKVEYFLDSEGDNNTNVNKDKTSIELAQT